MDNPEKLAIYIFVGHTRQRKTTQYVLDTNNINKQPLMHAI
jgi:hypothetical protein